MILGIGTDIASVARFQAMSLKEPEQLAKLFSRDELDACVLAAGSGLCPEKLAVRFAAKEAFYKALSASLVRLGLTGKTFSFLFAAQQVKLLKPVWGVPQVEVDWHAFEQKIGAALPAMRVHASFSHERDKALAFVVCESIE